MVSWVGKAAKQGEPGPELARHANDRPSIYPPARGAAGISRQRTLACTRLDLAQFRLLRPGRPSSQQGPGHPDEAALAIREADNQRSCRRSPSSCDPDEHAGPRRGPQVIIGGAVELRDSATDPEMSPTTTTSRRADRAGSGDQTEGGSRLPRASGARADPGRAFIHV